MRDNVEIFKGRQESFDWRHDKEGNIWLCPRSAKDLSECVGENIVDLTYSRGG